MCCSLCNSAPTPLRSFEVQTLCSVTGSTRTFVPLSRESSEKAKNRKPNQLVRGNNSSIAKGMVFWRALTIFTHHTTHPNRFKPGTNKAPNHHIDIEAARNIGRACSTGNHTSTPGLTPVFSQINLQQ